MSSGLTGSPILARQSVDLLTILIPVLFIFLILAAIYITLRKIHDYHNSPEYIEKKKTMPTTLSSVSAVGKRCGLTKKERELLWKICRTNKTPNIIYLVKNLEILEPFYREEFLQLYSAADEKGKANLFSLRKKLISTYNQPVYISQSKNIAEGTTFVYTASRGIHYRLHLSANTNEGLLLSLPGSLLNGSDKPADLSHIEFAFTGKDEIAYHIETRVIRYQIGKDGNEQLLVLHTDRIRQLPRRQSPRIEIQKTCIFSSVTVTSHGSGKSKKIHYTPAEKQHEGVLGDISTGGCRIITPLPIKEKQYIFVQGPFDEKTTDSAVGLILRSTKRRDNQYVLHIQFVEIDIPAKNRIDALVCGYSAAT